MDNNGNAPDIDSAQEIGDSVPLEDRPLPPRWWKTAAGRRHARVRNYEDWGPKLIGVVLLGLICLFGAWRTNWVATQDVVVIWVAMSFFMLVGRMPRKGEQETTVVRWLVPVIAVLCAICVVALRRESALLKAGLMAMFGIATYWKRKEARFVGAGVVVLTGLEVFNAVVRPID